MATLPLRKRGRRRKYAPAVEAAALHMAQDSTIDLIEIASTLNVPYTTVRRWVNEARAKESPTADTEGLDAIQSSDRPEDLVVESSMTEPDGGGQPQSQKEA